jgi:hypothetical protein
MSTSFRLRNSFLTHRISFISTAKSQVQYFKWNHEPKHLISFANQQLQNDYALIEVTDFRREFASVTFQVSFCVPRATQRTDRGWFSINAKTGSWDDPTTRVVTSYPGTMSMPELSVVICSSSIGATITTCIRSFIYCPRTRRSNNPNFPFNDNPSLLCHSPLECISFSVISVFDRNCHFLVYIDWILPRLMSLWGISDCWDTILRAVFIS